MEDQSLRFKALSWTFKDRVHESIFLVSGISCDVEGVTESTQVTIRGFNPWCYLELPGGEQVWLNNENSTKRQNALLKHINKNAKRSPYAEDRYCFAPFLAYEYKALFDLYGKIPKAYLYLEFRTLSDVRNFAFFMQKKQQIPNFYGVHSLNADPKEFKVHHHNIDQIIHLTYARKLNLVGWLRITNPVKKQYAPQDTDEAIPGDDPMVIETENPAFWNNYECSVENVFPDSSTQVVFPKYLSFDFECNSKNHNAKLPDPKIRENAIRHIGVVIGRFGDPNRRYLLLSLGQTVRCSEVEPLAKEGYMRKQDYRHLVEDLCFDDERDLILEFISIIRRENPDVFIGYNIMQFDFEYLIARAEVLGIVKEIFDISRFPEYPGELGKITWGSSAYGDQEYRYVIAHGRVIVDVMLEIKRNYKFQSYGLDTVSEYFLKQKKEDVSPSQMFMIFRFYDYVLETRNHAVIKRSLEKMFPSLRTFGFLAEVKEQLNLTTSWSQIYEICKRLLTMVGYYCVIDCILPIEICDQLNLWLNMEKLAELMGVPTPYLHSRGQQVKIVSQLYRICMDHRVVIPYSKHGDDDPDKKKKYQGAVVIEALAGVYEEVDLDDFESLYPSEMISNNICYTTYLNPGRPDHVAVPDCECNILEWETHTHCEHDPKRKASAKPEQIVCKTTKHRFRKVVYVERKDGSILTENEGLMSKLERELLGNRKLVKKELAKAQARLDTHLGKATPDQIAKYVSDGWPIVDTNSLSLEDEKQLKIRCIVLNAEQNGLKIIANSAYGGLGARTGYAYFPEGAESVTAAGRIHLLASKQYALEKFDVRTVYGDSVTEDTPILIRHNGVSRYIMIKDLFELSETDSVIDVTGKEYLELEGVECWSDHGFTQIKNVVRHKTSKNIHKILTHTGVVDVTEDHSLLTLDEDPITPVQLALKVELLHHDLPKLYGPRELPHAFSLGFFYGDGSCGAYDCPSGFKRSWALNNTNLEFLEEAKAQLELEYGFPFVILDTIASSAVYKLLPKGGKGKGKTKALVKEWREMFYHGQYKKVPDLLFDCTIETQREFFRGYYAADGDKNCRHRFDNKGKIGSAGLYLLACNLGYKVSINTRDDKQQIYRMTCTMRKQRANPDAIKRLRLLGPTDQYVYDVETDNHHFSAGVGRMVVHNTDSLMTVHTTNSSENPFARQERIAKSITHHLKCKMLGLADDISVSELKGVAKYKYDALPLNLQPESRFKKLILLTKKRYMAVVVDPKGSTSEIKKGTVEVKRDYCNLLKNAYRSTRICIFKESSAYEAQMMILDHVINLVTRRTPSKDYVIYKAIGKFEKYAKKTEDGKVLAKKYSEDGEIIPEQAGAVSHSDDPLDWFYFRPQAHVHLALKMLERGDRVPPNTRMEYVFTKALGELPDAEAKQNTKIEDYTYFVEHPDEVELDIPYYILHQLAKPISELLRLGWKSQPYRETPDVSDDSMIKMFGDLPSEIKTLIGRKKGVPTKTLYLLNNIKRLKEECTIQVGGKVVVAEVFTRCVKLCEAWYLDALMSRYYQRFGVNKTQRSRKKNKKIDPFMMDLLQTVTRHALVIDELHRGFERCFLV
jgi:DNA polymerase elongation subunit (family B)